MAEEQSIPEALKPYWREILALSRPAVGLVPTDQPGFSKLGGKPNLPASVEWPEKNGISLSFLAQFDLAAISRPEGFIDLPEKGALFFFYDFALDSQVFGIDASDIGSWQVVYVHDHDAACPERRLPESLAVDGLLGELHLEFRTITTLLHPEALEERIESLAVYDEIYDDYDEVIFRDEYHGPSHWLGGHFQAIQNPIEEECSWAEAGDYNAFAALEEDTQAKAISSWVPLFQFGTEFDIEAVWGDVGTLYFAIREEDLAKRDFAKTWMIMQC